MNDDHVLVHINIRRFFYQVTIGEGLGLTKSIHPAFNHGNDVLVVRLGNDHEYLGDENDDQDAKENEDQATDQGGHDVGTATAVVRLHLSPLTHSVPSPGRDSG